MPGADEHGLALWQKLMIYTSESARHDGMLIHRALVQRLRQRELSRGATFLREVWGFDGDHEPHGDKLFSLSRRVPFVTIVIDTPASIAASFDLIDEITQNQGLVTSEMVPALLSGDGDGGWSGTPTARHDY